MGRHGQLRHAAGSRNNEDDQPADEWAAVLRRLSNSDAGCLLAAVPAMRQLLASSSDMAAAVTEFQAAGGVPFLVGLLSRSDPELQCAALELLNVMAIAASSLQKCPGAEAALASDAHTALPALLSLFQRRQSRSRAAATQAAGNVLRDLAALPSLRPVMAQHGALEAAVQQLQHGRMVSQAAGLLANLCQAPPQQSWGAVAASRAAQVAQLRRAAVEMGGVAALVQCLEAACSTPPAAGGSEAVQQAASALTSLMQFCPEGQAAAKQVGALSVLMHLLEQRSRAPAGSPDLPALLLALASSNDWRCMYKLGLPSALRLLSSSRDSAVHEQAAVLLRWVEEAWAFAGDSASEESRVQPPQPQPQPRQRAASRQRQSGRRQAGQAAAAAAAAAQQQRAAGQQRASGRRQTAPTTAAAATALPQQAGRRQHQAEQTWAALAAPAAVAAHQVANRQRPYEQRRAARAAAAAGRQQHVSGQQRQSEQRWAASAGAPAPLQQGLTNQQCQHRQRQSPTAPAVLATALQQPAADQQDQQGQQRAAQQAAAGSAAAAAGPARARLASDGEAHAVLPARTSSSGRNARSQRTQEIGKTAEETSRGSQATFNVALPLPVPVFPAAMAAAAPATAPAAAGADAAGGESAVAPDNQADELEMLLRQLGVGAAASEGCTPSGVLAGGAGPPPSAVGLPEPASGTAQVPDMPAAAAAALATAARASASPPGSTSTAAAGLDFRLLADLVCPLTLELMRDPVVAADGNTYERAAIAAWIARQQAAGQAPLSPLTGLPLSHLLLSENRFARSIIAGLQAAGQLHHLG